MIGCGHDVPEEGAAGRRILVHFDQHLIEQMLVGDAPDIFELDQTLPEAGAVGHLIALGAEIAVHVVEHAVAAIDEVG